ncbi:hypothetical protein SAMN06265379_10213 [Saccharicrinis carchari]|uniref:Uncharacterized protein n=1 Tax=Saccharicrinis carchari TaxID=1168039 RepID=A0A521BR44_SACCC|nr:hypothetical protein [Saccharicrinis carchari]SMO49634.1 hypothetical protein SAMN06265379_10213 [Saccharicrinis carchari]
MKANTLFSVLASALLLVLLSTSCTKNDEPGNMPELPPVESLMMDFGQFIDEPSDNETLKAGYTYGNALYSYVSVSFWNVMVTVPMVIPVAVYLESFNHTPQYLGDNTWQWAYTVTEGADAYSARLVATRISNAEFTAEMFISKAGSYEDFKWFEGTVRYDRTHADWTMYESPANNVAWLNIEWNKNWEQDVSDISYKIVKPGDKENGSYITYGITNDADYDAFYTISLSEKQTFIKWNRNNKTGTVKDEVHYGDALWHCWNEDAQDVDCN